MDGMQDKFDADMQKAMSAWRVQRSRQAGLRRLAHERPAEVAGDLFVLVGTLSDVWKHLLEKNPTFIAVHYSVLYGLATKRMQAAMERHEKGSEEQLRQMCEAFFRAMDAEPLILDLVQRNPENPPAAKRVHLIALLGWIGSRISFGRNKRLASVLAEGGALPEQLIRELPGAALIELAEHNLPSDPYYAALVNRTTGRLEQQGDEAARLARAGKLASEETAEASGGDDEALAEFERQETLQQDIARLRGWAAQAGFSGHEAQVYELDMQTNFDTAAAARGLGVEPGTVRGFRKRYTDKLRRVAGL